MPAFKKIMFPVDLSDVSIKIVPYVKELAERLNAKVHVLFVARSLQHFSTIYVSDYSVKSFEAEIVKGAVKKLREFVDAHFKEQSCETKVLSGDPSDQILKYIRSEGIDLVVLGTHGRKGIDKIMLGSVADRVIKNARVPVLTVNPHLSSQNFKAMKR